MIPAAGLLTIGLALPTEGLDPRFRGFISSNGLAADFNCSTN